MNWRRAEDLLADVRRWDVNRWDLHDVAAQVFWGARGGPNEAAYEVARRKLEAAAGRGATGAAESLAVVQRADSEIDKHARSAVERQAGERLSDAYFESWVPSAKLAVRQAILAEGARSWVTQAEADVLTAGLRAASEKLNFEFTLETADDGTYAAAAGFMDDIQREFPGSDPLFDPPGRRPVGKFRVLGTAYIAGTPDGAEATLSARLLALIRAHDPEERLRWPPADFSARR